MRALKETNVLVAFERWLRMSSSSEREEEVTDPRYVNEELNVIRVPAERVIGAVSAVELSVPIFGMWKISVLNFFGGTIVHV